MIEDDDETTERLVKFPLSPIHLYRYYKLLQRNAWARCRKWPYRMEGHLVSLKKKAGTKRRQAPEPCKSQILEFAARILKSPSL